LPTAGREVAELPRLEHSALRWFSRYLDEGKDVTLLKAQIALELRVDVASVYRAVRRGDLPAVRLSEHGALRIHRSILDRERKDRP
jgi:hypothetical protein